MTSGRLAGTKRLQPLRASVRDTYMQPPLPARDIEHAARRAPKRPVGFTRLVPVKTVGRDEANSTCAWRGGDKFLGEIGKVLGIEAKFIKNEKEFPRRCRSLTLSSAK